LFQAPTAQKEEIPMAKPYQSKRFPDENKPGMIFLAQPSDFKAFSAVAECVLLSG
jgi:hypothetical protein